MVSLPTKPKPPTRAVPLQQVRSAKGKAKVAVPRSKVASTRAFRRIGYDRLFGAIGTLFILFSAYLVFNWEQPVHREPMIGVDWIEEEAGLFAERVEVARADGSAERSASIATPNVSRIALSVKWMDDVGDQGLEFDNVEINLTGPGGSGVALELVDTANATVGVNTTLTATVYPIPTLRQVPARNLDEAARALPDFTTLNGTGEWTLTVTLVGVYDDYKTEAARRADNCPPPDGIQNVCIYDPGQWVDIHVVYWTYHHEFLEP